MTTDTHAPTRAEIADTIAEIKARHDRLPVHYEARRQVLMDEIDHLVQDWLDAEA